MGRKIIKAIFITSVSIFLAILLYALVYTFSVISASGSESVGIIGGSGAPTFGFVFFSFFKFNSLYGVLARLSLLGSFSGILLLFHKK